jgi:hypothetical protein
MGSVRTRGSTKADPRPLQVGAFWVAGGIGRAKGLPATALPPALGISCWERRAINDDEVGIVARNFIERISLVSIS